MDEAQEGTPEDEMQSPNMEGGDMQGGDDYEEIDYRICGELGT